MDIHKCIIKNIISSNVWIYLTNVIGLLSVCTTSTFGDSLVSNLKRPVKCLALNNQPCEARPTLFTTLAINSDGIPFYPFTVSVNKCGRSFNIIVKNVKVIYLMSGVNEIMFSVQHESCDYKYKLNGTVRNSKQKWSHNKWRFDCK